MAKKKKTDSYSESARTVDGAGKEAITLTAKQERLFAEIDTTSAYYRTRPIELQLGLMFSQYQTLRTIDFYYNSRYLTGNIDQLGREKPFRNISKFRVGVAMRATDIDIKDCSITADTPTWNERSFILNHEMYEWMKNSHFDITLDEIGRVRAKYGGVLAKRCYETNEDGELTTYIDIPQWKNMITDQIDIQQGVKIERFWLDAKTVYDKKDVWDNTKEAVELASKNRKNATNSGVNTQGNTKEVEVWDVEGYFCDYMNPFVTDSDDESVYKLMHFIIATNSDTYLLMYSEELDSSNYKYCPYDIVEGRALGVGVVEDGFDAQTWTNDAVINQKNAMDLAGKVILKTNSKKVGTNVLTDADNGRIYELEDGKDITPINLMPNALPMYENLIAAWDSQYERVSSTFSAFIGEGKGGQQAYRQTAMLANQADQMFQYRRKQAGNFIAEILNDWVLPDLIKKINKAHILSATFTDTELSNLDESFAHYAVMQELINSLITGGDDVSPEEFMQKVEATKQQITGSRRYLDIPKDYFKGFKGKVSVNVAGELNDKSATISGLTQILQIVGQNPAALQDPTLRAILDKIMELDGGLSPISLPKINPAQQANAQGGGQVANPTAVAAGGAPAENMTK